MTAVAADRQPHRSPRRDGAMPKPRRTVLSGVVPFMPDSVAGEPVPSAAGRWRSDTIQQTVYLPSAVHDQLRELAFVERVKMHALINVINGGAGASGAGGRG
jgi:hypothetical protein